MKLKAIGAASIIALMVLAGIGIHAEAHTEDEPMEIPLYAGQDMLVGHVSVWNDGDYVYVEYNVTEENWYLSETHLHIGDALSDIPQTVAKGKGKAKSTGGNPIPGQFDYINESHDLYTTTYMYTFEITEEFELVEELYIAAHAVVSHMDTMWVYSDATETYVAHNGSTCPGAYMERTGTAVSAWEHSAWIAQTNPHYQYGSWIWESYRVLHPVCGDVVNFSKTFNIPGYPVEGRLQITVDNGYEAWLNGVMLGSLGVNPGWYTSDLKEAYVISGYVFDITNYTLANLVMGDNTFLFACANEYSNTDDIDSKTGKSEPAGTVDNNPGGLIYEAEITYIDEEETAWADGEDFPGNNWATYFTYHIQPDFTTLELIYSTDMETWYGVEGSYEYGFGMGLSPNVGFYYITTNNDTLETNSPLADGYYGFYVDPTEQNLTYWNAKGVYEGCTGTWEPYMWHIINGTGPIFYLKVSNGGTDYMVLDGLLYDWAMTEAYLRVNGDYPLGTYHYTGTITSIYGIDNTIEITITFVSS
ncbi:MAG TPA: hypothetical protein ENN54_00730 [Thermoplasmatales archaeon]|nr:hypothetical protein [Thermoplasmatales archaeon]